MIKQGTVSRTLSRTSLVAICGAAAFALPLTPSIGQEAPAPPGAAAAGVSPGGDVGAKAASSESPEVAEARQRVQQLRRELESAMSRLAVLEHGASGAPAAAGVNSDWQRGGSVAVGSDRRWHNNPEAAGSYALPRASAGAPPAAGIGNAGGGGIGSYRRGETDPRFESLEKQLHELMNQVRELRETQQKEHNQGTKTQGPE